MIIEYNQISKVIYMKANRTTITYAHHSRPSPSRLVRSLQRELHQYERQERRYTQRLIEGLNRDINQTFSQRCHSRQERIHAKNEHSVGVKRANSSHPKEPASVGILRIKGKTYTVQQIEKKESAQRNRSVEQVRDRFSQGSRQGKYEKSSPLVQLEKKHQEANEESSNHRKNRHESYSMSERNQEHVEYVSESKQQYLNAQEDDHYPDRGQLLEQLSRKDLIIKKLKYQNTLFKEALIIQQEKHKKRRLINLIPKKDYYNPAPAMDKLEKPIQQEEQQNGQLNKEENAQNKKEQENKSSGSPQRKEEYFPMFDTRKEGYIDEIRKHKQLMRMFASSEQDRSNKYPKEKRSRFLTQKQFRQHQQSSRYFKTVKVQEPEPEYQDELSQELLISNFKLSQDQCAIIFPTGQQNGTQFYKSLRNRAKLVEEYLKSSPFKNGHCVIYGRNRQSPAQQSP